MRGGATRPVMAVSLALAVIGAPVVAATVDLQEVAFVGNDDGAGVWVEDDLAFVTSRNAPLSVVDVSQPDAPVERDTVSISGRDVDVTTIDGRRIAVVADHSLGIKVVDATDPDQAELVGRLDPGTSHNVAVVEGTPYVYNSRSGLFSLPGIDIVDISDPENPHVEAVWSFPAVGPSGPVAPAMSCHDITVFPDADRAYCAAHTQTVILDISDPLDPTVLGTITNPGVSIHHWAHPTANHDRLVVGDEAGGTVVPACTGAVTTGQGTVSAPTGALWVYDISDPATPVPRSWVSVPAQADLPCTSHFGDRIGPSTFAVAWYDAGVVAVDVSGPVPTILDQWRGATVWDVRHADGHLFTGSMDEGMHVLSVGS